MAKYVVMCDFQGAAVQLKAGQVIDDSQLPLTSLQAAGLVVIPYNTTMDAALARFATLSATMGAPAQLDLAIALLSQATLLQTGSAIDSVLYGTGVDGVAVFDGTNTFSFASKASSVYTLTRDVFLADGSSIASGVTVKTAGFRIFCNGVLTNNGTISCDGNAGALGVAGASTSTTGTLGIGVAGGAGSAGVGTGTAGTDQTTGPADGTGAGGAGGAGLAQAGGAAGAYTPVTAPKGGDNFLLAALLGVLFGASSGTSLATTLLCGGAGGGGGGADNAGVTGGGGGGGGGVLAVHVLNLVNNGTISAVGGAGAAASGAGGNGGGGGGGGGGLVLNVSRFRSGSGSITVAGGAGGAKVGASGVAGSAGAAGHVDAFTA